ncbi:MAG: hypothetical protein KDC66_02540 [Phaeodactylibacter sp.]|nr:hypothetical protein [Phaeodactylibacter sp.]MCB9275325.1 hypothetical protein [Lewinellaceae bacterium]
MNLRVLALLIGTFGLLFTACDKDDSSPSFDAPKVTAPSGVTTVEASATGQTVSFTVSIDQDLTATYAAVGTGVTISNATGSVSGSTVTINYDAGSSTGAASITLTVTDSEGQSAAGTAVFNITKVSTVRLTTNISADATWTADKVYVLGGRIAVLDGVTLTIEPGTVIKGEAGTGANATALLVARGGKLMAEGTADAPIIFTSVADEITPDDIAAGNFASPNLDPDINGLWGGLIVLGKAKISASNDNGDVSEVQIEGIPTSDPNGLYGGDNDADNSGVLKYISIRHGGTNIGEGNEINGLTLGGVGSGTVIENIEIVSNQDDGIEWFGGTVNVKNIVVWNVGDDGIDTDQAYAGTIDNFVVITPAGSCFELDGPEGTYTARHTIQNGTVIAVTAERKIGGSLIDVDNSTPVDMKNIHFVAPLSGQGLSVTEDEVANSTFENVTFDIDAAELSTLMEQGGAIPAGISAGGSSQANTAVMSWTWAAQAGQLSGL